MSPKRRIVPVFVPHDGCEHACVFCNQRKISGKTAGASPEDVRIAAGRLLESDEPAEIAFYGGSFTAIPITRQRELLEAAQPFLSDRPNRSLRISTRPDCIDNGILDMLNTYGVRTIELGAQSMCDDVLSISRRGHTAADVSKAAKLVKERGFELILQMMTGLPGDTREKSIFTARSFIEMQANGVRVYPTVIVEGTYLQELWLRGEYMEHTVDEAVSICAVICSLFIEAAVPIIRLGLNPTEYLSAGFAIGGAYHPAFGELVYSKIFYDKAAWLLESLPSGSVAIIAVPRGCTSKMIGHKGQNISQLKNAFGLTHISVVEEQLGEMEILIDIVG